jgi:hypothetical protein
MAGSTVPCQVAIALGLLGALPCAGLGQAPQPSREQLAPITFSVDEVRYRIAMPTHSALASASRPGCAMIWYLADGRAMKFLELCTSAGGIPARLLRRAQLPNGARVDYMVDYDIGGGSGGTEGELKGHLALDGKRLALTCRDQSEWGPRPEWCLSYLGGLQVDGSKQDR